MGLSNYLPSSRISQAGVVPNTAARSAAQTCTKCKEEKEFTEFYKKEKGKNGLSAHCKTCHKAMTIRWKKNNKEKMDAINQKYRDSHKKEIAELWSDYYEKNRLTIAQNKKHYRENNKELRAAYQKEWYKKNPSKGSEYAHRRRARELASEICLFKKSDWDSLLRQFNYSCAYCGSREKITKDHVVPLSRGGRHSVGNIVPACGPCNFSKHSKFLVEWRFQVGR